VVKISKFLKNNELRWKGENEKKGKNPFFLT
jgi:hypothetical protein